GVAQDDGAVEGGDGDGDPRAVHAGEALHVHGGGGDARAGVAGGEDDVAPALGLVRAEEGHLDDGGIALGADGLDGRLVHADDLRGVLDGDAVVADAALREDLLDVAPVADENKLVIPGEEWEGVDAAFDDRVGRVV